MLVEFPDEISTEEVLDILKPAGWGMEWDAKTRRAKAVRGRFAPVGCALCGAPPAVHTDDGRVLCSACYLNNCRTGARRCLKPGERDGLRTETRSVGL